MELNERQIEEVKNAARKVRYGKVSIEIAENWNHVDITYKDRLRVSNDATVDSSARERNEGKGFRT
jgi:hypothetical protein